MNFSMNEIIDFIKTLIVPVLVSGIVSYLVSRATYKYECKHSDDIEIFNNLYKNLLFLKDNFFQSVKPMIHASNYYNVPCDLWDDIKKDKRYFVVNKKQFIKNKKLIAKIKVGILINAGNISSLL